MEVFWVPVNFDKESSELPQASSSPREPTSQSSCGRKQCRVAPIFGVEKGVASEIVLQANIPAHTPGAVNLQFSTYIDAFPLNGAEQGTGNSSGIHALTSWKESVAGLESELTQQGKVHAWAHKGRSLTGGSLCLDYSSVGATETLMMAAALADGHTTLSNVAQINCSDRLRSCYVKTLPYPGFPTDLHPQLMSLLTTCSGQSVLEETAFEGRMRHAGELQKLGAQVKVSRNVAVISGKDAGSTLYGAPVLATDLRAGAALVLAGMAAEGTTYVEGIGHVDRGYRGI